MEARRASGPRPVAVPPIPAARIPTANLLHHGESHTTNLQRPIVDKRLENQLVRRRSSRVRVRSSRLRAAHQPDLQIHLSGALQSSRVRWSPPAVAPPSATGGFLRLTRDRVACQELEDPLLGLRLPVARLKRVVEMYQWHERTTKREIREGNELRQETHYDYGPWPGMAKRPPAEQRPAHAPDVGADMMWSEKPKDSSHFRYPSGHENPRHWLASSETFNHPSVQVGDFTLAHGMVVKVPLPGAARWPPHPRPGLHHAPVRSLPARPFPPAGPLEPAAEPRSKRGLFFGPDAAWAQLVVGQPGVSTVPLHAPGRHALQPNRGLLPRAFPTCRPCIFTG